MKKVTFTLTLKFEDKVSPTDENLTKIADNVIRAIEREAGGYGITPEDSETYLTNIEISNDVLGIHLTKKI